jgi:hypothetical protein
MMLDRSGLDPAKLASLRIVDNGPDVVAYIRPLFGLAIPCRQRRVLRVLIDGLDRQSNERRYLTEQEFITAQFPVSIRGRPVRAFRGEISYRWPPWGCRAGS